MASSSSSSSDQAPAAIDPVVWIGEYCLAHELHDVVQLLNQRFVESLRAYTHGPEGIENSPVAPMARRYHLYLVAGLRTLPAIARSPTRRPSLTSERECARS